KVGQAFLEKAAAEKGATKLPSGLVMTTIKPGAGASPKPTDRVKVNYSGALIDGTVFDSSAMHKDKEPAVFQLNGVIPCWTEGLQKMKVGEKARLVCPSSLAYGDRGAPPKIKPGSTLVFDVELVEIMK
ncbi:MAG TPA: FKBP-type peptidyl-prolyl cis-trans isomerase, partial [Candidatus Methylomirabilis sp.]|nr:FKBP-type peptidyl-prolyl cis-trans isomerase [Candidatus Methylomirabilis sp.]